MKYFPIFVLFATLTLHFSVEAGQSETGCGSHEGCLKTGCTGADAASCESFVGWTQITQTRVSFELTGTTTGWVSVCFSNDMTMGEDSCIDCQPDSSTVKIQQSYNPGKYNIEAEEQVGLTLTGFSKTSGMTRCLFDRELSPVSQTGQLFSLAHDKKYYVMVGIGQGSGVYKSMHSKNPVISSKKVAFSRADFPPPTTTSNTTTTTTTTPPTTSPTTTTTTTPTPPTTTTTTIPPSTTTTPTTTTTTTASTPTSTTSQITTPKTTTSTVASEPTHQSTTPTSTSSTSQTTTTTSSTTNQSTPPAASSTTVQAVNATTSKSSGSDTTPSSTTPSPSKEGNPTTTTTTPTTTSTTTTTTTPTTTPEVTAEQTTTRFTRSINAGNSMFISGTIVLTSSIIAVFISL